MNDQYLGDGVYASFDGYHIILDLRKQDASRIALEPQVLNALNRYREGCYDQTLRKRDPCNSEPG